MNDLIVYASPLPMSNKQIRQVIPAGGTVKDILDVICPARYQGAGVGAIVSIAGHEVLPEKWHCIRPKAGMTVNVRIVPMGGGGGGKNPIVSLLSIAVLVAAPYLGTSLALATGLASQTAAGVVSWSVLGLSGVAVATAAVGIVGTLLISALAPPPKPTNFGSISNPTESPTQFIEGARNSMNPYGVIPICLGTNRMFPLQAARPYSETQNNDQYVRQLFTYGYGDDMEISDLRIGETALSEFNEFELSHRLNGNLHLPTSLYSNDVFQNDYQVLLQAADDYTLRTTQLNVDEALVDVTFPQGLSLFNNNGQRLATRVQVSVEYSPTGANSWTAADMIDAVAAQTEALRLSRRIVFPTTGTYDIRVKRLSADTASDQIFDKAYLTAIQSVTHRTPVKLQGLCGTAVRIKATDQLNGALDQLNVLASNRVPDYDADTDTWIVRATSNPASLFRYVLQGRANARALPDSKLDLAALADWHTHCAAQGYSYNRVIDYETSVDEILRDVAAAGAASPAIVDNKRTVIIDRIKDEVVQLITPRNSWSYSGEMTYPDLPHAFRVQFRNAEKGYQQDERIVYDDGYSEFGEVPGTLPATKFEALELQSCTNAALAFKAARRHIAAARLRPETHTFMLDVENLVALRGDRIKLEHDVPIVGVGDGRIKSVQTSGGNVTGFTLDDTVTIPAPGSYYARIRLSDGKQLYRQIVAPVGDDQSFAFVTPFPDEQGPAVGDLCAIMAAGGELDLIISRIEAQDDLTARITALDYAPAIFTAEGAPIPAFSSRITTPLEFMRPLPPSLISEQSDETVMLRNSDGSFTPRAIFTLRNSNEGNVQVQVKIRRSGSNVFTSANVLDATAERLILTGLDDGARYDIHIRYFRQGSNVLSLPLQLNNYKFIGASGRPDDVTGFTISVAGDTALFKWDANDDIDLSHYRIKYSSAFTGAEWGSAQLLEDRVYENRVSLNFLAGTYLIKAVDLSGNESETARAVITYDPGAVRNVVATLSQQPGFAGVKDNVTVDDGGLVLVDPNAAPGYYYFTDRLDLSGVFTAFVRAEVTSFGTFVGGAAGENDIFAEPDIFAMQDVYGIGLNAWETVVQYRVTNDDPSGTATWSDWTDLAAGNIEFWAIEFRLKLISHAMNVSPLVVGLSAIVDMPDRIERGEDVTVPTAGVSVTYPARFMADPSVSIMLQDGSAYDEIEYMTKDAGGFSFRVYNTVMDGYVARTFDYIASGYGREKS